MTKDKSRIQSCVDHINTAVDVDPWAKELVAEMGKEILEQLDNSNDCIDRQAAIDALGGNEPVGDPSKMDDDDVVKMWERIRIINIINKLPSVQPEPCEDAVSRKAVEEMLKNGFPARGMWEIEGDVVKQTVCETLADALMDLGKLPSVQPDIIACGDCKHYIPHDKRCGYWNHGVKPLEWCCHAERRTDETD